MPSHLIGPGTSLKLPGTNQTGGPSPAVRSVQYAPLSCPLPLCIDQTVGESSFIDLLCILTIYNHHRPITQAGRPITGFLRPSTQSGRPGTMEQAIRTPRTAYTARPITSSSGRFVRLGTVHSVSFTIALYDRSNFCHITSFFTTVRAENYMEDLGSDSFYLRWLYNFMHLKFALCFKRRFQISCSIIFSP